MLNTPNSMHENEIIIVNYDTGAIDIVQKEDYDLPLYQLMGQDFLIDFEPTDTEITKVDYNEIESSKKRKPKTADEKAKDEGADITCSRKQIKSSFNYYDGFEDDVKFFAEKYSDNDDIVEMVAGDIENEHPTESPEEFDSLMRAVHEELKRQGYFKQPWQVNSSRQIKSAIDGGWEVDSSDVPEALDLFVEHYGEETALEEIAKAMSTDTLLENVEWVARQWGFGEDLENVEGTWNKYEYAKETMGVKELFNNLTQAAGYDELAEDLAFIFRQYDFREWDKYDNEEDIYSSKINSSKEDKADEDGPHMKFKTLDEDTKFELREQIEDELEALLDKLNVKFTTDVWEETVQYILSFFEEDNAYNPKTAKQAVHEWYLDTKDDFPEMFDSKKQKVASARYCKWIRSKRLIKSSKSYTSYGNWKYNTAVLPVSKSMVQSFFNDGSWSWDDTVAIVGTLDNFNTERPAVIFGSNGTYSHIEEGRGLFNDQSWNDIGYFSFGRYEHDDSVFSIPNARYFVLK